MKANQDETYEERSRWSGVRHLHEVFQEDVRNRAVPLVQQVRFAQMAQNSTLVGGRGLHFEDRA